MNPEQSRKLVRETFEADFDRKKFGEFIDRLLKNVNFDKHFTQSGINIRRAFVDKVSSFERVGQFTDDDGKKIDILIVNLKRDLTLERGRTGLRNFAADYLQSERGIGKAAVLIAYASSTQTDWRFSYVTLETDLKQNEKGIFKEEITSLTPARRFSFLVGKNENSHTAQRQFYDLLSNAAPKLQNIEEAFNIEKVTKEFFAQYKELFEKVRAELNKICQQNKNIHDEFIAKGMFVFAKDENGNEKLDVSGNKIKEPHTDDFAKKLLGQIVFLYFLQKKGWFGVERDSTWGTGDKNFLRNLFRNKKDNQNFFDSILEPLFYNALAVKREHDWSDRFDSKIPFLNGGLFEPLNNYDWVHTDIFLPDSLFSNSDPSYQGDKGTGILDVFDRYNFTINEAEPLEVEVAVDPEMLGKIFENLLPENIRHGSGTYYTPRVIVAYMCQQSLINYLATHLDTLLREDVENFIRFGSQQRDYTEAGTQTHADKFLSPTIIENAKQLDALLAKVTVCDPAIGSGAFPVGMMLEIVKAREALQSVETVKKLSQYELKRQTIENSLYGVDIDSGAVEIAKLRLWLSLIVDESDFQNIEPLPNLDYKIMQGNSLLDEFHGVKLIDEKLFEQKVFDKEARLKEINDEISQIQKELGKSNVGKQSSMFVLTERRIKELQSQKTMLSNGNADTFQSGLFVVEDETQKKLERLKSKHKQIFNETRKDIREKLREEAENLEWEFIAAKLGADGKTDELAELENHRKDRRKKYFLWQLNFPEIFQSGGFDVVIGNPPYIKEYTQKSAFDGLRSSPYYQGKMDIWYLFACNGLDLSKKNGLLCFIATNNWTTNSGASKMRNKVIQDGKIEMLIDFGSYMVFESASIQTMVMLFTNDKKINNYAFDYRKIKDRNTSYQDATDVINRYENTKVEYLSPIINRKRNIDKFLTFNDDQMETILRKIEKKGSLYLDGNLEVAQGIVFPQDFVNKASRNRLGSRFAIGDGIFAFSNDEKKSLNFSNKELKLIKPYFTTEELGRYFGNTDNKLWLIYTDSSFKYAANIQPYPNLKRHLDQFKDVITSDNKPYGLHRARNEKFFQGEKIIALRKCSNYPVFTYTEFDCYVSATFYIIKTDRINQKYLTGFLNSKLVAFWLRNKGKMQGNNYQIDKQPLLEIPICEPSEIEQMKIIKIVEQILEKKRANPQAGITNLENQIDEKVYRLYELTQKEIDIVEGNSEIFE